MTHLRQLLADVLAAQAEAAAEDCGADAWSAVTAGAVTAAEYWQAVQSGLDDESEAYWEGYCQAEEERGREERRRTRCATALPGSPDAASCRRRCRWRGPAGRIPVTWPPP